MKKKLLKLIIELLGIDNRNTKVDNMIKKIDELKNEITLTFMRTQNLIISTYFDKGFENIADLEGVEYYRRKLCNFKPLIGTTDGYNFFNDYYMNKMDALEHKYNMIENGEFQVTSLALVPKKENKLIQILKAIKKLIFGAKRDTEFNKN